MILMASGLHGGGSKTRLVDKHPGDGHFVKTERGYMVPYQQKIPGSDAVIEMLPVSGGTVVLPLLPEPTSVNTTDHDDNGASSTNKSKTNADHVATRVTFDPFWIGKCEITMEQYMPYRRLYYEQKKAQSKEWQDKVDPNDVDAVTGPTEVYDSNYNFEFAGEPDSPVPSASQFATRQYTKWLSLVTGCEYRLPLRSEWQHACLAGSSAEYCFGEEIEQLAQYAVYSGSDRGESDPLRAGQKKPNTWGLHDVHGNVSEFVIEDTAPTGLVDGHVACGGNWESDATGCTATSVLRTTSQWWDEDPDLPRSCWWMASYESRTTGFRIIAPLDPMSAQQKRIYWDSDSRQLSDDIVLRLNDGRGSVGRVGKPTPTTTRVK